MWELNYIPKLFEIISLFSNHKRTCFYLFLSNEELCWNHDMVFKPALLFHTMKRWQVHGIKTIPLFPNHEHMQKLFQYHRLSANTWFPNHATLAFSFFPNNIVISYHRLSSSSLFGYHEKMRNHCFDPMKYTNSWYAHIVCAKTRIDNVSPLRMCSDGVRKLYGYHRFVNECNFLWDANNDFSTVYGMQTTSSSKVSCFEIITMQLNMVWKNESANFVWFWNHGFAQLLWYWNNLFMFAWFGK